jgi:hypothetical protein
MMLEFVFCSHFAASFCNGVELKGMLLRRNHAACIFEDRALLSKFRMCETTEASKFFFCSVKPGFCGPHVVQECVH